MKTAAAIPVGRTKNRTRLTSDGEEEGEGEGGEGGGGGEGGVSSFMADHSRNVHNSVISLDLTKDYEFTITGRFQKPQHRQVVEYLNITRAEQEGKVNINHNITWKVQKELMNRQDENWSWGQKTKLTAGQKSWGR